MLNETDKPVVLEAGRGQRYYWRDVVSYRDLFFMLARRDVAVRYKQAAFGVAWAVLRPLLTMLVFTLVFGRIAKLPSGGVPYSIMVFSGMLPWFFFSGVVSDGSASLLSNANLLSKIYFPRIILPSSAALVALIDFAVAVLLLLGLMAYFGLYPTWRLLTIPLFLFIASAAGLGLALWLSVLNVRYRDFQFVVPFLLQFGMYVSPVAFAASVVPKRWGMVYALNPMVGVIGGFRWAALGSHFALDGSALMMSGAISVGLLISGVIFFRRYERDIADVI